MLTLLATGCAIQTPTRPTSQVVQPVVQSSEILPNNSKSSKEKVLATENKALPVDAWIPLGKINLGYLDLDSDSVNRNGSFVAFRTRIRLFGPDKDTAVIAEHNVMDCRSGEFVVESVAAFDQDGKMRSEESFGKEAPLNKVSPEIYNAFCSSPKKPQLTAEVIKQYFDEPPEITVPSSPQSSDQTDLVELIRSLDGKAYIVGADNQNLGVVSSERYDDQSICNKYGAFGSRYSATSVWNPYGEYGGRYSDKGTLNPRTSTPPRIVFDGGSIYITNNPRLPNRIAPEILQGVLCQP
ncbi:hypothetical protein NDI49_31435 [Trichocoleus sp. ST-U3]